MFFDGYGYHGTSFEQTYRCYPASFIEKPQLESGDKIIMPPSALDRLASLHIDYPMLFELRNDAAERVSHCGVLEFIAEEGMIYMPYWMMENMLLQEGDIVRVKNVTLPKGTYVKLQPHTKDFLDISNPKAILETTLRNFSCLTTGDSIMVAYNNKKYYIDIIESKPANAISIIETDCEVDFAPPLDYKEPERPIAPRSAGKAPEADKETPAETEPKFNPFTGSGRRLDGKPLSYQPPPVTSSGSKDKNPAAPNVNSQSSTASSSQSNAPQTQGKLVFGSNPNRSKETGKATEAKAKQEPPKEKEDKFQPFTGKKYSLRDRSKVKPFPVSSFRKLAGHYCLVFALKRFGKSEVQRYNSRCRVPLKQNKIFGNSNLLLLTFVSLMKNVSSFIAVERNHPSASELAPSL
ncbi:ubiquitin fusion degradation protein [Trifolium repens]|nr:ubiquitin fusion degradation protein [Trifolium repens]